MHQIKQMRPLLLIACFVSTCQLSAQQFCLETLSDFQTHFTSLFSGASAIDSYGNIKIDGQTGGFGGWPEFRLSDVEISLERHPLGMKIQGEPAPPLATIHYSCRKGACIKTKAANRTIESAYTMMSAARAERCFEFITYLKETPELWE